MEQRRTKFLVSVGVAMMMLGLLTGPASAVSILWKAPNANITIGLPYNSLEFEDPVAPGTKVNGYTVLEWRDADYTAPNDYADWTVNDSNNIDGDAKEVWMRWAGHSITTTTLVPSSFVSIHLQGDDNDGLAQVWVDTNPVAKLDMGTRGIGKTALIIVRNLVNTTHTITVTDLGIGPRSRIGDDVATLGACALSPNWNVKWWHPFWFLNARIQLVRTRGYITVPTGFWWGWWWRYDYGYWYRPWQGPVWWYKPYCRYWYHTYWDYWPYYRYYRPWWHHWRWRGDRWFWGFRDRLTYRYTYYRPRIIYWWSWYWDPAGKGGCIEFVTEGNETDPAGGRVRPFTTNGIPGFDYDSHTFTVNGKELASHEFSNLEFVQTGDIETWVTSHVTTGEITPEQVEILMDSEIVQELQRNDPGGTGYIGIQWATWDHPQSAIVVTTNAATVMESGSGGSNEYEYTAYLADVPLGPEIVKIVSSDPDQLEITGADPNGVLELHFDTFNWDIPQPVTVTAVSDSISEGETKVVLAHYLDSDPNDGFSLDVTILDDECGGLGYNSGDINGDCKIDLYDLAEFADQWQYSSNPSALE